ncbi:MAG: crystallin J1 [Gammaproteobacteria bacterium HGW-Gammaproteobacteria-11]|nr:MAG: crystallin J1 [Gammaproteobacteria bacterium HGW-Gammaproteobacteria-11]
MSDPARILGCLLGGAVGDALGAAVEFSDWATIQKQFGPAGIRQMVPAYGRVGAITDDTQMMLFTAEGLIRATVRGEARGICDMASVVHHALLRWLATQHVPASTKVGMDGWLITESELWSRRAPGNTCLSALSQSSRFGEFAVNASKGCGGVMRVAACAFFANPFELGSETARLSHGHPTGYLAAGLFADILKLIWREDLSLHKACVESLARHGDLPGMEETRQLVESVLELHAQGIRPTPSAIERLGGGWIAEEALAIGLWCALSAENLEEGVVLAVNHSGDSDSTGLIAGNLLGLIHGPSAIPGDWLSQLELRQVITQIAADITFVPHCYDPDDSTDAGSAIWLRYPGW